MKSEDSSQNPYRGRRRLALPLLLLALFPAALLWKPLFGGCNLSGGDIINSYIPYKNLAVEQIRAGEFPHWNPLTFSGRPLQADVQIGVFYPPNAIFLFVDPLNAFDWLVWAHLVWGAWGALLFFRRTLRDGFAALIAASVFAFSGFFATQLLSGIVLFIFTGAWLPWMLWAAEIGLRGRRAGGWLALAAFGALQLLAGAPQIAFYSWILVALYTAVGVLSLHRGADAPDSVKRPFAIAVPGWLALCGFGAAAALAAGLTAVQWAPAGEFLELSFDRAAGASWDFVTDGSLQAPWTTMFVAPFLFQNPANDDPTKPGHYWGSAVEGNPVGYWEFNGFVGVLALALAAAGLAALRRRRGIDDRRLAFFALGCLVLWLALAPGRYSPLFRFAYWLVPGFDRFRVPARWVLAYQLGLAALAGLGWKRVSDPSARRARAAALGVLAALAACGVALAVLRQPAIRFFIQLLGSADPFRAQGASEYQIGAFVANEVRRNSAVFLASGLRLALSAGALLILVAALWRRPLGRAAGAVAVAAVLFDLGGFALQLVRAAPDAEFSRSKDFYADSPAREALKSLLGPGERWSWDDSIFGWNVDQNQLELYPNKPILYGLPAARGYDPVNSRRYGQYSNAAAGLPLNETPRAFMFMSEVAHPRLLSLLNVRAFLSYQSSPTSPTGATGLTRPTSPTRPTNPTDDFRLVKAFPFGLRIFENLRPRGMAWLARPALVEQSDNDARAEAVFARLLAPEFDWRGEAVVEEENPYANIPAIAGLAPRVELLESGCGRFQLRADSPAPAVLVLSQSYYPGWRATVDGEVRNTIPVDWALTGVFLEPGEHQVEFDYHPAAFDWGRRVSLICLILFALAAIVVGFMGRKRGIQVDALHIQRPNRTTP